jgi:hypothetical protein
VIYFSPFTYLAFIYSHAESIIESALVRTSLNSSPADSFKRGLDDCSLDIALLDLLIFFISPWCLSMDTAASFLPSSPAPPREGRIPHVRNGLPKFPLVVEAGVEATSAPRFCL